MARTWGERTLYAVKRDVSCEVADAVRHAAAEARDWQLAAVMPCNMWGRVIARLLSDEVPPDPEVAAMLREAIGRQAHPSVVIAVDSDPTPAHGLPGPVA